MLVCKMLMSFLAALAINARYSHSHTLTETKQDCSCFPIDKDNVRISKLADAYGNHIRKVIYLFRHPDSGKVTVYLPNELKQKKFPDLTVSKLEHYGLPKLQNLYQLFEDDQKLVTTLPLIDRPPPPPPPVDTSFLHITDTDNDVYQHHPLFNTVNTNTDRTVNVDEMPDPALYDQIFTLDLQNEAPESVNQNIYPIINDKLYTTNKEQAKDYFSPPKDVIDDKIDGNSDEQDTVDDTISLQPWDIDGKDLMNDLDIIMKPGVKPDIPPEPATDKQNIFLVHDNQIPNHLDTNRNFNQHNDIPTNNIGKPIFDSVIQSNPLKPQTKEVHKIVDNSTPHGPVSPGFDEWLFEEIKNIGSPDLETSPLHPLDLQKIKVHLLNVLRQSGLHPENDHLIDIYGYTSKFSNIKLRRVLISEPSVYMQLLTGNKCPTSHNIPYLEAIFVSLAYPPKVLGLIPLRMTFLPQCHQYGCMGDTCAKKNYNKPVTMNAKLQNPSIYKGLEKQGFPVRSGYKKLNLKLEPTHVDSGVSRGRFGYEGHKKIPTNLDHLKLGPPPIMVGGNDGYVVYEDQGERTLDGDNDDGLGIRIIGGNAATSSGTPVNSRGRRAYPFSLPMV